MARTHLKILFVAKTVRFPSEKIAMQGGITIATPTRSAGFAAGNSQFLAERVF